MSDKKNIIHTADNELSHSMAHYLLTIHKLREEKGYARVTDIAKDLGLTKGSVSTALNNLKRKDLVVEDENKFLSLSKIGHDEVHRMLSMRTLMYYFLADVLDVESDVAHKDSCLVEHLLSSETRVKLFEFMKKVCENPKKFDLKTQFDLAEFDTHQEFMKAQKGDSYL
jgi:DtxR family Mn-dependent transcriptional regulator